MSGAMITIIILAVAIVLYATEKIPIFLTAMLSMLAVYFSGVLNFSEAFSGFGSNPVMMLLGMFLIGDALKSVGLIDLFVQLINDYFSRHSGMSEYKFLLISCTIAIVMCMFVNAMLVITMFMYIIDSMASQKGSVISRKNTYLPLGIAVTYGVSLVSVSSTTVIVSSGIMADSSVGRNFTFFEPAAMGLPAVISLFIFLIFFGKKASKKWFDFDDIIPETVDANNRPVITGEKKMTPKMWLTLATLAVCIIMFIFSPFALGACAVAGGVFLLLTGCMPAKNIKNINWTTIVLVASCLGFAKAFDVSGAGKVIADFLISISGPIGNSAFGLCIIALIVSSVLSNFMSNSSSAAVLVPIFLIIAQQNGYNPVPFVLAAGVGCNMAVATPICTASITVVNSAGYRFKDYVRFGGTINIMTLILCSISLYVLYFM